MQSGSHQHEVQISNYQNRHYLPQPLHTSVEISPSQSFELKPTGHGYAIYNPDETSSHRQQMQQLSAGYYEQPTAQQSYSQEEEQHSVPVIVLRIPGPHKYAAHLQALLQQYLELRAADYIKALQEQEYRLSQQQQQYVSQQYLPASRYTSNAGHHGYHQQQEHQAQPQHYQQSAEPTQYQQQEPEQPQTYEDETDQNYYIQPPVEESTHANDEHEQYQRTYDKNSASQTMQQPHYQPQYIYVTPSTESTHLPLTENFPSKSHTQVYFKKTLPQKYHPIQETSEEENHQSAYLPPLMYTTANHHHQQEQEEQQQHQEQQEVEEPTQIEYTNNYQHSGSAESDETDYSSASDQQNVVAITQRSQQPYNYHAHPIPAHQQYANSESHHGSSSNKRQVRYSRQQQQLQKMNGQRKKVVRENNVQSSIIATTSEKAKV